MKENARCIAFYLPQYHPTPENDLWWGKGFTEWTNVTKAKPLFKGHYQPILPSELGFYDLRVPEIRKQQAELAKEYGIEGFCYWHYWFGNGKRILERPFDEVLLSKEPNFPFCLAWANESWTGIWHGLDKKVLIEQKYPGTQDYINHFNQVLPAFLDDRYIRVNDMPLFMVYLPENIPNIHDFVHVFQSEAIKNGLKGIYLVATNVPPNWDSKGKGFDAITLSNHSKMTYLRSDSRILNYYRKLLDKSHIKSIYKNMFKMPTHIYEYKEAMKHFINDDITSNKYFPMVIPNWDNSARSGLNAFILHNSSPELFEEVMVKAVKKIQNNPDNEKIIFIKSWNEWAEGNYLEPDRKFGRRYLEVIKKVIKK